MAAISFGSPRRWSTWTLLGENVYFGAHGLNPDPPLDFPFSGYIGAIVAVQGPISDADLAQLETLSDGQVRGHAGRSALTTTPISVVLEP